MLSRQFLCLGRSSCSSWGASWSRRSHHQKRLSAVQIDRLAERLRSAVGPDNVSLAEVVRSQHSQDEGPEKGALPDLVVYATSTEHVSEVYSPLTTIMQLQAGYHITGGGTYILYEVVVVGGSPEMMSSGLT